MIKQSNIHRYKFISSNNKIINMKERFSSAKSQLARLIDPCSVSPVNTHNKQASTPSATSPWINDSMGSAFQPTGHNAGSNKSVSETSTCTRVDVSESSSFDIGIQGKIQRMMARTKNIEQKLITQFQTSPRNKVLSSNSQMKADKPLKNFQRVDKFKQQLQNQLSVRESFDDRKQGEVLESLWKELLGKPFDLKVVDDDMPQLMKVISEWKQNSKNYQILSEQILSTLQTNQTPDLNISQLLHNFLSEKGSMHQQLNSMNSQLQRLTHIISRLEQDRAFYLNQINERDNRINVLDSEIERLKLNNNCLTEIICQLQQKKIDNETRVQRGVYDHLKEENYNLKNTLAQIVEENKHLTIALTEEISFVREVILEEVKEKFLIHADLLKAESTIEELRKMSVMDIAKLKNTINRQFQLRHHEVCQRYVPQTYQHGSTQPSQQAQTDLLQSRLTESNEHILHLQGLLDESRKINGDMETQRHKLEALNRKEEYQKQKIKKQLFEIKKVLCEGESMECEGIDAELMSVHQKALQAVYKYKNLKEKSSVLQLQSTKSSEQLTKMIGEYDMLSKRYMALRLSKNPSGNQQKLIELENTNTQLAKDIANINQILRTKQEMIDKKDVQILSKDQQLATKDEEMKDLLSTIQRLMCENRKIQEQRENQIVNPERTQNVSQQEDLNDLKLQLQANMSDSKFDAQSSNHHKYSSKVKRLKSLSFCSQQDQIIQQDIPNAHHHAARSIGQKSQISDCWNNTSGIHELAVRIDSLGVLTFKIDQLFDKHNMRGQLAEILGPFLKKLDKMQNLEELLTNIQEMLLSLKSISQIHTEQNNAFLKFNLGRMEELFVETRLYLQNNQQWALQNEPNELDSEDEDDGFDQLTLQSVLQI